MSLKRLFFSRWFYNIQTKACRFFWRINHLQFGCRWLLMNAYYLSTCWHDTMWHGWWSQKPWQLPWDIFVELCHQFLLVKFTNCPVNHMPCAIPKGQMLNICSLFLVIIQVLSAEKCHHTENVSIKYWQSSWNYVIRQMGNVTAVNYQLIDELGWLAMHLRR